MTTNLSRLFALAACVAAACTANSEIRLAKVFTDHMVLQRDVPVRVWGTADAGETITVSIEAAEAGATADATGYWIVTLPAHAAGGPFTVSIHGKNSVDLHDVLFGDIWIASGQSNMEMPLSGWPATDAPIANSAAEIASANYPQIRLLHVTKKASVYPLDDLGGTTSWIICSPETVGTYTAVGFFFARSLWQHEHVPIGVVDVNWGGTPVEAWTALDALAPLPELPHVIAARAVDMNAEAVILRRNAQDKLDLAAGKTVTKRTGDRTDAWAPGGLYNGMIAPLTRLPVRGVIWFQGESNAGLERARDYEGIFRAMIIDWRAKWHEPEMPFLYAQISGFNRGVGDGWPTVRDAQRRVLTLPQTGMAVTFDVGETKQIHFAHKEVVGDRLALLARSMVYGESLVSNGPLYRGVAAGGNTLRVNFDSAIGMHAASGASLGGFEVAGADGIFKPAQAKVDGNTVVLQSAQVSAPVAARYGWRNSPNEGNANLVNAAGLPASPFTSLHP